MTKEISQSHIKLVSTPTAGLPGEHSPYYRRLMSAGYKGYLQGTIGGSTLYGLLGAAVGAVGGLALLALAPTLGLAAFGAVPFFAGYGLIKGATTFGSIGSNAAQLAEYAETNERRRALLDRLAETPSKEEAVEIQKMLAEESHDKGAGDKAPPLFHWKTALIGAALGAAVGVGLLILAHALPVAALGTLHLGFLEGLGSLFPPAAALSVPALGALFGAAAGAMLGVDRFYIRKWMDGAERTMHDQDHYEELGIVRENEISKLDDLAKASAAQEQKRDDLQVQDLKLQLPSDIKEPKPNQAPLPSTHNKPTESVHSVVHADRVLSSLLGKASAV